MPLYDYQQTDFEQLKNALNKGKKRILFEACTGYGKSYFALHFIKECLKKNKKVIFCTNREQLIFQIQEDFAEIKKDCSVYKAGYSYLFNINKPVQIIMLQSFNAHQDVLDDFDCNVLIIDEVHLMYSGKMMTSLIEKFADSVIIGLTATGIDERGYRLSGFDCVIDTIKIPDLISKGYLSKAECYTSKNTYNLSKIGLCGYDYNQKDVELVVTDYTQVYKVVDCWEEKAKNKKTIVFVNCIKQGELLEKEFNKRGYEAFVLHSKIPNLQEYRQELLKDFREGKKKIIINVQMLVEGFSDKEVECIVLALLTRVLRKILQIYGRGLRISPTKQKCIYLDCGGNFALHGLPDEYRFFEENKKTTYKSPYKECPECGNHVLKHVKICDVCGYEFGSLEELEKKKQTKAEIEKLEKAMNLQKELKEQIYKLVVNQGYKRGFAYYLFIDTIKNKHSWESAIQFFNRKLKKIEKIKKKGYKISAVKYD